MGWGTSPRFVQGRYVVIVYNSREVLDTEKIGSRMLCSFSPELANRFSRSEKLKGTSGFQPRVFQIFQTEVKDCIPLLESEARAYCKRKEQENPKEKYNYTIIDRKNTLGGLEKNDESL